jgi:SPP1 gp7 family putative phage head morphogenesis protein
MIAKALGIRINGRKQRSRKGAHTWRQAAQAEAHGKIMYEGLKREMSGSTGDRVSALLLQGCKQTPLTRGLPSKVIRYIHNESIKGRRATAIAKDLHEMLPGMTNEEIERISQTVVSKASTALTRAKAEELDLDWYRWRSSKDARVRESHRLMDGVLITWTDPPEITGFNHAGEEDACRCYCEPLLRLDRVTWPAKVCKKGCIETMTKTQFKRIQRKGSQVK